MLDGRERQFGRRPAPQTEDAFRLLVSGVKDYAIFMLDTTGAIVSWNEGAERIKGYREDEIVGRHFSVFYEQGDIDAGKPDWELLVAGIDWRAYVEGDLGEPTLRDILAELERPGRDPRGDFSPPAFREDLRTLDDLRAGMVLQGVVTNVTAFGAFVDVGVHQDGLVHVSELADRFVRDPAEVVEVGRHVAVRVLGVDLERRRLSLSMRAAR